MAFSEKIKLLWNPHCWDRVLEHLGKWKPFATQTIPPVGTAAIGAWGEEKAAQFLKKECRYRIICRNWRRGRAEIDIIAWDDPVLVFVEVRTRKADAFISGYFSITQKKKRSLNRACRTYLAQLPSCPKYFRCDVIEVELKGRGGFSLHHYENIPLFNKHYFPHKS